MSFRKNIEKLEGYVPGLQLNDPEIIKLNTNENPYSVPKQVWDAIDGEFYDHLRLYPDPTSQLLREKIAQYYSVGVDQILVGNGSDDLLRVIFQAIVEKEKKIVLTKPTYSLFPILAKIQDAQIIEIEVGLDSVLPDKIPDADLLVIASPNAPSGAVFSKKQIKKCCESFDGMVLLDEAYADFAQENCLDLINEFANLMITRSMSKSFSLAALRIGYLFSQSENIKELNKVRDSYNLNHLSQIAAMAAMDSIQLIQTNIQKVIESRNQFEKVLKELDFEVVPSQANFVFAKPSWISAKELYEKLLEKKVLIRYFSDSDISDYVRISIGAEYQMDVLEKRILELKNERASLCQKK